MGAGAGQAESSGGSVGSAGAAVSRHAGAAGKGGGWLMGWECRRQMEIGKSRLEECEECEEKIPTRAPPEWGAQQGSRASN
jgi:hypothetical protein